MIVLLLLTHTLYD